MSGWHKNIFDEIERKVKGRFHSGGVVKTVKPSSSVPLVGERPGDAATIAANAAASSKSSALNAASIVVNANTITAGSISADAITARSFKMDEPEPRFVTVEHLGGATDMKKQVKEYTDEELAERISFGDRLGGREKLPKHLRDEYDELVVEVRCRSLERSKETEGFGTW